jgi:hypothetical protein
MSQEAVSSDTTIPFQIQLLEYFPQKQKEEQRQKQLGYFICGWFLEKSVRPQSSKSPLKLKRHLVQ